MTVPPQDRRQVASVDGQGAMTPLPLAPGVYGDPSLSPDGRQIALAVTDTSGTHIWVYDLERGTLAADIQEPQRVSTLVERRPATRLFDGRQTRPAHDGAG